MVLKSKHKIRNPHDEDKQLVQQAHHDLQAFGVIFDKYYPVILAYIVRRTADTATAEDITSEVFIKAMQHFPQFNWQGFPISAWLYKIAINELRMHYRKQKRTVSLEDLQETSGFELPDEHNMVEELIEAQAILERKTQFIQAHHLITTLPVKYQEVLTLRFTEHKKLSEISLILGKREGTVKSLLSRGLKLLRAELTTTQDYKATTSHKTQPFDQPNIIPTEGHNQ